MIVLIFIVVVSGALMLIRPGNIPEAYWVGSGALLLVLFRLIPIGVAGHAVAQGLDVYLFLLGMMLMSELAREHGLFAWVSAVAVTHSRGSAVRLFTWVYVLGVVVTVFMSNDATAVVLTPAILPALRKARVDPLPGLFACVLIANAASFVLPISNPANLVVFHGGMPPLGQWLGWLALPSLCSIASTYVVLRVLFRASLRVPCQAGAEVPPLTGPARMILAGLGAMTAVLLVASALEWDLGAPTCGCAVAVAGVVSWQYRANPLRLAREISWSTLLLVAGLFVLVNGVESAGVLRLTTRWLGQVRRLSPAPGVFLSGFAVGTANNLVNNLPLGLLAGGTLHAAHAGRLLANAILIGIDLGPNLSITGSLATVLWLIALRRNHLEMSFGRFLKIGSVAMPAALLVSLGGLLVGQKLAGAYEGPFKPTIESLKQYRAPEWFRDAKFGIWAHWGPQAVPEDGDWYARRMYLNRQVRDKGLPNYNLNSKPDRGYLLQVAQYGHPSKVGYKDIIPLWKAEKWDPDRLMALYVKAGAKYFVSMGVHHDNFDLWDSTYQPRWNAVKTGPHRDVRRRVRAWGCSRL